MTNESVQKTYFQISPRRKTPQICGCAGCRYGPDRVVGRCEVWARITSRVRRRSFVPSGRGSRVSVVSSCRLIAARVVALAVAGRGHTCSTKRHHESASRLASLEALHTGPEPPLHTVIATRQAQRKFRPMAVGLATRRDRGTVQPAVQLRCGDVQVCRCTGVQVCGV